MSDRVATTAVPARSTDVGAPATTDGAPRAPGGDIDVSPSPPVRRTRRRLAVVAVVLSAAFGSVLALGLGSSLNYFDTVDQALAHKSALGAQTVRLEGVVVPGSIRRQGDVVAFSVAGTKNDRITVVNRGSPPQLFQPGIPVVVVGHFTGGTFWSDQVIVDHSAQYVQQHPNRVRAPNGTVR